MLVAEKHHQPVETKRNAAVGWRAVFQRIEQRPKTFGQLIAAIPHQPEYFFLIGALVQADTAAADFETIQCDVVLLRPNFAGVGEQEIVIFLEVTGEWIVRGVPAVSCFVPLKQREVRHPAKREHVWIRQFKHFAEMLPEGGQRFRDDCRGVGDKETEIAL